MEANRFFQVVAPLEITGGRLVPEAQVELSVMGIPKRIYRVRSASTLTPDVWTDCYNYLQEGPVQVVRFPAAADAASRIYQVTTP